MRTTLDIDDDLLGIAKEIAAQRGETAGAVISRLARAALVRPSPPRKRNGLTLMDRPRNAPPTTLAEVNRLRDED